MYEFPQVTVILEIMIRKCGFSAVESDIPEKHKSFFKTVLQVVFFSKNIAFSMWFYFSFLKHFD